MAAVLIYLLIGLIYETFVMWNNVRNDDDFDFVEAAIFGTLDILIWPLCLIMDAILNWYIRRH